MQTSNPPPNTGLPWHKLLAPLPADAVPRRSPVAPPEVLAMPEGAAIAGWENLTVDLSAGAAGLRVVLVLLDETGRALSASDLVLYRSEGMEGGEAVVETRQESLGGRLEEDGTFRGTRWQSLHVETAGGREIRKELTPAEPRDEDVVALKGLVEEMMKRSVQNGNK